MTTLRDNLQAVRINRMKQRVHTWWRATHCESCRQRREAGGQIAGFLNELLNQQQGVDPEPAEPRH